MNDAEEFLVAQDEEMPRCRACGHVEDFHDDGSGARGRWCLALNCACGEWEEPA